MDKRLSLGINASIILILIIFCALLSLPLRYLFNTNYKGIESPEINTKNSQLPVNQEERKKEDALLKAKDFRKMKVCPFNYETWMKSLFVTNYDNNCTEKQTSKEDIQISFEEETKQKVQLINADQSAHDVLSTLSTTVPKEKEANDAQINKSIPVAVHILTIMLVVSVIVALVEVVRIRFARDKVHLRSNQQRAKLSLSLNSK